MPQPPPTDYEAQALTDALALAQILERDVLDRIPSPIVVLALVYILADHIAQLEPGKAREALAMVPAQLTEIVRAMHADGAVPEPSVQ